MKLAQGLLVTLVSDEFRVGGAVEYSETEHDWVARFDWNEAEKVDGEVPDKLFVGFGDISRFDLNARILIAEGVSSELPVNQFATCSEIFVDYQNRDPEGRFRLTCIGTINDLWKAGVKLRPGLKLMLVFDEFRVPGTVEYSETEHIWAARFDENEMEELQ